MSRIRHPKDAIHAQLSDSGIASCPKTLPGEDAMRSYDAPPEASAKRDALRRLTIKPHPEKLPSRARDEYRIRLYDGDRVVGYIPVPSVLLMTTLSAMLWAFIYLLIHLVMSR